MRSMEEFLTHFRRQRRWTLDLVAALPEDRFSWSPGEGSGQEHFSLGGLVRHLMQAEIFWRKLLMAGARGEAYDPFRLPGGPSERLQAFHGRNVGASRDDRFGATFAECLKRWREIQSKTEAELATITGEQLAGARLRHPLAGIEAPLWEMLLLMVEHEAHHRGQLSASIKVLGLPHPPLFTEP